MNRIILVLALLLWPIPVNAGETTLTKIGEAVSCFPNGAFRAGPGVRFSIIGKMKVGTTLAVFEIFERNWIKVRYDGQLGWVHRTMVMHSGNVPLNRYGIKTNCPDPVPSGA